MDPIIPQVDDKAGSRPAPSPPTPGAVLGQPDSPHHLSSPPPPQLGRLPPPCNAVAPPWLITKISSSLSRFYMMNSYNPITYSDRVRLCVLYK